MRHLALLSKIATASHFLPRGRRMADLVGELVAFAGSLSELAAKANSVNTLLGEIKHLLSKRVKLPEIRTGKRYEIEVNKEVRLDGEMKRVFNVSNVRVFNVSLSRLGFNIHVRLGDGASFSLSPCGEESFESLLLAAAVHERLKEEHNLDFIEELRKRLSEEEKELGELLKKLQHALTLLQIALA